MKRIFCFAVLIGVVASVSLSCARYEPLKWEALPVPAEIIGLYSIPMGEQPELFAVSPYRVFRKHAEKDQWQVVYAKDSFIGAEGPIVGHTQWGEQLCIVVQESAVDQVLRCYDAFTKQWLARANFEPSDKVRIAGTETYLYYIAKNTLWRMLREGAAESSDRLYPSGAKLYSTDHGIMMVGGANMYFLDDLSPMSEVFEPVPFVPGYAVSLPAYWPEDASYALAGSDLFMRTTIRTPVEETMFVRCSWPLTERPCEILPISIIGHPHGRAMLQDRGAFSVVPDGERLLILSGQDVLLYDPRPAHLLSQHYSHVPMLAHAQHDGVQYVGGLQGLVRCSTAGTMCAQWDMEQGVPGHATRHHFMTAEGDSLFLLTEPEFYREYYQVYKWGEDKAQWKIEYAEYPVFGNFRSRFAAPTIIAQHGLATPDLRRYREEKPHFVTRVFGGHMPLIPRSMNHVTDNGTRFFATNGMHFTWTDISVESHIWEWLYPDASDGQEHWNVSSLEVHDQLLYAISDGKLYEADVQLPHQWDYVMDLQDKCGENTTCILRSWKDKLFVWAGETMYQLRKGRTGLGLRPSARRLPEPFALVGMHHNEQTMFLVGQQGEIYHSANGSAWRELHTSSIPGENAAANITESALAGDHLILRRGHELWTINTTAATSK